MVLNLHKFDLQVGTNADGKARFIGLPENPKQGLFFRASEGDREGVGLRQPLQNLQSPIHHVLRKNLRNSGPTGTMRDRDNWGL